MWSDEVIDLVHRGMRADGLSAGELARMAAERYGVRPESFERQLRAAAGATGVMRVHTADELLTLVGCHIADLPCYHAALHGELPADQWPMRGRRRETPTVEARRPARRAGSSNRP